MNGSKPISGSSKSRTLPDQYASIGFGIAPRNWRVGQFHRPSHVKNTGDGFLADFSSVVDAVRCAVEVQRAMAERNAAVAPEIRTRSI